ncbi:hypothetical protein J3R30DRAFT_3693838 [Lentinula aciculospora]|uniref:Uncharacterized protein n=1 Tax=Lentinula aciculospora TaxID=153920 RepID=A0A9W9ATL7_9AGAR|nr:hypothetical protein J3R30DRAFT_3693838 [Lentinula aciculospora]
MNLDIPVVVVVTMTTSFELAIPNVMLGVIGVVLGFTISYRAASAYERYWLGRTAWSDLMKTSHSISRLIWYHIPPCKTPRTSEERSIGEWKRPEQELLDVMNEKKMALDLVEGFSVALKHHLRGASARFREPGLYYDDLYDLVRPFQPQSLVSNYLASPFTTVENLSASSQHPTTEQMSQKPNLTSFDPSVKANGILSKNALNKNVRDQSESDLDMDYDVDDAGADRQGPWKTIPRAFVSSRSKYRPKLAGEGDNLPLEILRCLSEWCSVLEDRGTVPGTSLSSILSCISTFEDKLTVMEKILTVPLPLCVMLWYLFWVEILDIRSSVYNAHIRQYVFAFFAFILTI